MTTWNVLVSNDGGRSFAMAVVNVDSDYVNKHLERFLRTYATTVVSALEAGKGIRVDAPLAGYSHEYRQVAKSE
jgi:hypothetical protein